MPLTLRPTGLSSPAYRDWLDYVIAEDGRDVGRLYEDRHSKRELRWFYSRPGNDLTRRFPLIVEALARLRPRSCIIDGEAVACGDDGIALFDRIRYRRHDADLFMWAFV